uniref:Uncharacterized protein n=1 Tax=Rhizophora mucronata TaxID=61149 RepID=A0A2P2MRJ1_RHIMU
MKFKLLFPFLSLDIPHYCCFITASSKKIIPFLVPLQRKYWSFMFTQSSLLFT